MSFIVPPPAPFVINDDNVEGRFVDYKNKFLTFMKANGFDSREEGQKIAIFKSFCGEDLCDQIESDETEQDSLIDVLQRLHEHYLPASNELQERFNFFTRKQRPSENFDKYLIELKRISKNCNFGELEENLLKVVLIMNIENITEQQKILKDADNKKLDALVPDFRKFDAIKKTLPAKKNKNQPQKQNQQPQPQPQKQNQQPQPQKQNQQPQPQKQNQQPQPQNQQPQPQKQNQQPQPQKQNQQPQPQKQNQQPQPQKQNQLQSQKQNAPQPPKEKQTKPQPQKQKQPVSDKEAKKNGNPQANAENKEKKGDKKKAKPKNDETSVASVSAFADDLVQRIQSLST